MSVNPGSFAAESNIDSKTSGLGRPLNTDNVPCLKERLENRAAFVNHEVDFIIPEDAFLDNDGETTLAYSLP